MTGTNDGSDGGQAGTTTCPRCGDDGVIEIRMTLQGGEKVLFHSCHNCEHKWWETPPTPMHGAEEIGLDDVLSRVKPKRSA